MPPPEKKAPKSGREPMKKQLDINNWHPAITLVLFAAVLGGFLVLTQLAWDASKNIIFSKVISREELNMLIIYFPLVVLYGCFCSCLTAERLNKTQVKVIFATGLILSSVLIFARNLMIL